MGGDQHLATVLGLALHFPDQARDLSHHILVERQLGFFEQQQRVAIQQAPHNAQQPQCAVRELFFALKASVRPPVLIQRLQVRLALLVFLETELAHVGHAGPQCHLDLAQSCVAGLGGRGRHTFQKALSKGVAWHPVAAHLLGVLQELRHQVQIGQAGQEVSNVAKFLVAASLLQCGLRHAVSVTQVVRRRA